MPASAYWSKAEDILLRDLESRPTGLSAEEAASRLGSHGPNTIGAPKHTNALHILIRQFLSPLVLILIFAATVSSLVGEIHDAIIISAIVLASCLLGFSQEYGATKALLALKQSISLSATVLRNGMESLVPASTIVPGDIIRLAAGSLVPADGVILSSRDLSVSEAALTGETFPVSKMAGICPPDAQIAARSNCVFTGTSVRSGTATVVAVDTGGRTEYAAIAGAIAKQTPETDFSRGIRRFGYLMTRIMLMIVIAVLVANLLLHRPLIDSLLFSLALAVGLTPELLPAIISVTLARGARGMASGGVIIRRLDAIENLGSMNLLCTDKTGTLTEGVIKLDDCVDPNGIHSDEVHLLAALNASLQTGLKNPLDDAILLSGEIDARLKDFVKKDEIPYDFMRKRLSIVVDKAGQDTMMVCKGAVANILSVCTSVKAGTAAEPLDDRMRTAIEASYRKWGEDGIRVIAIATRHFAQARTSYDVDDECELCLEGFLLFLDPPKSGIKNAMAGLKHRGIDIKIISGDNRYIVKHLAETIGLSTKQILTGEELASMSSDALFARAPKTDLFVEIDPNQKELIVKALRRSGHVVGYMGDGINDAPALHEADVGISVDGAVDVAREAADLILLQQDLNVLIRGVDDGRRTFANTMKYISIATSANFGNMISMAIASLFLPFLPLLAKQILLNNLLADIPSMAIATDRVDPQQVLRPRRWDIRSIQRFMLFFGPVSSLFDFVTFAFLLFGMHATTDQFRTGWFVESLITQLVTMLIVRTTMAAWKDRPGPLLLWSTVFIALIALGLPYFPQVAGIFDFTPLPIPLMAGLIAISAIYAATLELVKRYYFRQ
ncbi:magnesium-translocating P-type ATPase [Rhizobium lusitanum]|uniref:Magnesium-transporting ATPase, P-type 1 n=1 Tax=Rhizobium lusitanum TaxID=293958 RepID=A0A6L9U4T6_9HYPH|nr:magnesium-translocating P-type ATPase [Rhizobium lusitanum]NEI69256.1 magnesium-translocating P-type ATPase [Rhizobium lusitanum]